VLQQFQSETGIKVVYDVYDTNEVLEAKLLAGHSGYDLVFPTDRPFAQRNALATLMVALVTIGIVTAGVLMQWRSKAR